jgi:hypothetical protein
VPPFVGAAVNVTLVPAQIAPLGLAVTLTEGTTGLFTVIVIGVVVAVGVVAQVKLDVIITFTWSPFVKLASV